ncbi:ATP-binding cassette superfamily [Tribonema minus]|uniref:ATP-binding cassette superfamily n=1 Tax=Tribonema minus TaxID=303371 RepID=A0A835Z6M7_9STRA|nr:ATP-binding cassette superfamily [Tribonema minus]
MKAVGATFTDVPHYRALSLLLLALTLAVSGVGIVFNFLGRDFWEALSEKDPVQFGRLVRKFLVALLVGAPLIALQEYVKDHIDLAWRCSLTRRVLRSYLHGGAYYALELEHKDIDNPDQRVTEDVDEFTETCVSFFVSLGASLLDLIAFSAILFSIHPPLFLTVLAYSTAGTCIALALGHRLVGLNMGQIRREADFRYSLVRVRENAEAIAFYGGERAERRLISRHLDSALENTRRLIATERNLGFFTAGYELLVEVLPALLVAPVYFAGRMGLGQVSQVFSAFSRVLYSTSIIIDNLASPRTEELSSGGSTLSGPGPSLTLAPGDRLLIEGPSGAGKSSLLRAIAGMWTRGAGAIYRPSPQDTFFAPQRPYCAAGSLREQLMYPTPPADRPGVTDRELVALLRRVGLGDLPLRAYNRCRVAAAAAASGGADAVDGAADAAGAGDIGSGGAAADAQPAVMGAAMTAPLTGSHEGVLQCAEAAATAPPPSLPRALPFLDGEAALEADAAALALALSTAAVDWEDALSLGEQQRLAFARLLFNGAALALLDEATSALDAHAEAQLYALLRAMPGLTLVSVGHRRSLAAHHGAVLTPDGGGRWSLGAAAAAAAEG